MMRVLWKEWREKRLWAILFLAFVLVPGVVCGETLSFGGHLGTTSFWTLILALPALLLGMTTFSRETGYECQDFLFSRPIAWKQILLAKFIVDAGIMLSSVVIGSAVFWITLPRYAAHFIGVVDLLSGIAIAFGVMLIGYIPGLGASVVVPGVLGSGMVLCLIGAAAGIESVWIAPKGANGWIGLIAAWVLGGVATSMLMGKRGLGLSATGRAKRYAVIVGVMSTLMLFVTVPIANRVNLSKSVDSLKTDISPDGRYLLVHKPEVENSWRVIRRSDGTSAQLSSVVKGRSFWYAWNGGSLILCRPYSKLWLHRVYMSRSGQLSDVAYPGKGDAHSIYVSSDGRYAAISLSNERPGGRAYSLEFVDTRRMTKIRSVDLSGFDCLSMSWRSNSVLSAVLYPLGKGAKVKRLFFVSPKGIQTEDIIAERR